LNDILAVAHAAMRERDWETLRPLLHPYLHWTLPDGTVLRGRRNVLAMLKAAAPPAAPSEAELRDGQVYRWRV
jgi:hypothetical protein